jgi:serine phosphatase RsbU (regulator of sigma subunit)
MDATRDEDAVSSQAPTDHRGRVLLVEDDEDDALFVCDLLEEWPHLRVEPVATIAAAADRLEQEAFDCVLLDLGLPDARGLEGVERLLALDATCALIVLTGDADERRGMEALGAGAQDYLVKGRIDAETLRRAIRYAVERKVGERARHDLVLARASEAENARLQRGLLPSPIVDDPRVGITAAYRPGSSRSLLGGDFYDVVQGADGMVHAIVGDVCGHGPDEAALGVRLRMAWRTLILAGAAQDELFRTLDRVLMHERERPAVFASLVQVSLEVCGCDATVRLAGHPPPILLAPDGARVLEASSHGPLLGVQAGRDWPAYDVDLGGDWTLLLYTDGIFEGRTGPGPERLGVDGLLRLLDPAALAHGAPAAEALETLITQVEELNGGPLTDDVAIVALSCGS